MTTRMADEENPPAVEEAATEQTADSGQTPQPEQTEETPKTPSEAQPDDQQNSTEGEAPAGDASPAPEGDKAGSTEPPAVEGEAEPGATEGTSPAPAEGDGSTTPKSDADRGSQAATPSGETAEGGAAEGGTAERETGEQEASTEGKEGEELEPVPQSDTFAEGERPESSVAVGEKLSREATPEVQDDEMEDGRDSASPLIPGTPELGLDSDEEEEEEEYYEEEDYEEEPEFDREQLIERYHQALAERQQFQEQNYQLQHKLAEYFRKKKSDDSRLEADKNVTDQEQRYLKYMANLDELRRQDSEERDIYKLQIEELKDRCQDKQGRVDDERVRFMEFKRQVAVGAVNSRSGKPIMPKDIEQYLSTENRKEAEVVNVRLENIKLKNKLKKKEGQLKSKEELAEGLHLIDFEQLKIENQTYNEKIEERNEELLKLRKKITTTVQVLTHLKEKLQFVQAENQIQQAKLREVEELAARKRDILSRTKQARDALRIDNQKLRQNCGLLGNEPLLRDFEERKDESDDLQSKLDYLKTTHAELTLNLNGVRRKIEQARSGHQR